MTVSDLLQPIEDSGENADVYRGCIAGEGGFAVASGVAGCASELAVFGSSAAAAGCPAFGCSAPGVPAGCCGGAACGWADAGAAAGLNASPTMPARITIGIEIRRTPRFLSPIAATFSEVTAGSPSAIIEGDSLVWSVFPASSATTSGSASPSSPAGGSPIAIIEGVSFLSVEASVMIDEASAPALQIIPARKNATATRIEPCPTHDMPAQYPGDVSASLLKSLAFED